MVSHSSFLPYEREQKQNGKGSAFLICYPPNRLFYHLIFTFMQCFNHPPGQPHCAPKFFFHAVRWLPVWSLFPVTALSVQAFDTYPANTLIFGQKTSVTFSAPSQVMAPPAATHTSTMGVFKFKPVTSVVSVGNPPQCVAIGDFNGDGKQDFATANPHANSVSVRLGNGKGGFSGATNIMVGSAPYSVVIGDFNGDGKQDFATANALSDNLSISLGDGKGGFGSVAEVAAGIEPHSIAIGDFNEDGKQDFATANFISDNVSIHLGNGLGDFSVSVGSSPHSIAIGDFNGDGKQDFATANRGFGSVSIRLGDGKGDFIGITEVAVGTNPFSVAIGDFNGDGWQDFATANESSQDVSIRLGDGKGNFSGSTAVAVGASPQSVAIGDFNGDGKQDFATANSLSHTVSICLGDGTGGFNGNTNLAVGTSPRFIVVGDFNRDGKQDFATANHDSHNVSIRLGNIREIHVQGDSMYTTETKSTFPLSIHAEFVAISGIYLSRTLVTQNPDAALTIAIADKGAAERSSVKNTDPALDFTLSPNPANQEVLVSLTALPETEAEGHLLVYNAQGRLYRQQTLGTGTQGVLLLPTAEWPTGLYWISVQAGGRRLAKRLVVSRQ